MRRNRSQTTKTDSNANIPVQLATDAISDQDKEKHASKSKQTTLGIAQNNNFATAASYSQSQIAAMAPPKRQGPSLTQKVQFPSELEGENLSYGEGLRWHTFSQRVFANEAEADKYQQDTGITAGLDSGVDQEQAGRIRVSRRGSPSGRVALGEGKVGIWRLSSFATSRALSAARKKGDQLEPMKVYEKATEKQQKHLMGSGSTPNYATSVFGRVKRSSDGFEFVDTSYAEGISGRGLSESSEEAKKLYAPSYETMEQRGKKVTASFAHHSEPMAITLHNKVRTRPLDQEENMVGILESYPNQICGNCGPMLSAKVGRNTVVAGNSGVVFQTGIKGVLKPSQVKTSSEKDLGRATLVASEPAQQLVKNKSISDEVAKIIDHHSK